MPQHATLAQSHRNIADGLALPSCTLTACSSTCHPLSQFLAPKGSQGNTGVGRAVSGADIWQQHDVSGVGHIRSELVPQYLWSNSTSSSLCALRIAPCSGSCVPHKSASLKSFVHALLHHKFSVLYATLSSLVCHPSCWQANSSACFCQHFMNSDTATHLMCHATCVRRCGVEGDRDSEQSCVCARE